MLLAHFDWNGAIEIVTSVELQTLLVSIDIQLNPSNVRIHCEDADVCSFWRGVSGAVEDEGIVVAGAIKSTVIDCVEDVSSDLFWRGEVEGRTVDNADRAIRDLNVVDLHVARRIGHVECVV